MSSAGVELGTLKSLVGRAHSLTLNADAYEVRDALALPASPDESRELDYEWNFAIRKISVQESVQLVYAIV